MKIGSQKTTRCREESLNPSHVIAFALFLIFPAIAPFVKRAGTPILVAAGLYGSYILWRGEKLGKVLKSQCRKSSSLLFAAFMTWALISLAWTPSLFRGLHSLLVALLLVFSIMIVSAFPLSKYVSRFLALGLIIGGTVIAIDLLTGLKVLLMLDSKHKIYYYNQVLTTYSILAAALLSKVASLGSRTAFYILILLTGVAFLSNSQTAQTSFIIIPLVYITTAKLNWRYIKFPLLTGLAFLWLAALNGSQFLANLKDIIPESMWEAGNSNVRLRIWHGFAELASHGLPIGWGIESSSAATNLSYFFTASKQVQFELTYWHPHNNILQIAVELGLVGFFLSYLIAGILICNEAKRNPTQINSLLSFVCVVIFIGSVSHGFWQSWWWTAILIGWYCMKTPFSEPQDAAAKAMHKPV